MLPVLGKKAVLEWCMKEGLIGSSYVCPKCGKSMELRERTGIVIFMWQPKPSSLRAQAQLMRTETVKTLRLLRNTEVREQALPSAYHRQTYLLK
ncbi:hypothetical protein TNCV_3194851 [Trichonephila clavipes]|uniref:Uncharacterized protein n=1 Tax=Trichonephila clavipes TaxID=2585209 RepID=A0A8X6RDQ0_TRICX|nr:hypothetical protein TNCV_3194851 [Trichonephila clavipes]